jgi:hypothetical protein
MNDRTFRKFLTKWLKTVSPESQMEMAEKGVAIVLVGAWIGMGKKNKNGGYPKFRIGTSWATIQDHVLDCEVGVAARCFCNVMTHAMRLSPLKGNMKTS